MIKNQKLSLILRGGSWSLHRRFTVDFSDSATIEPWRAFLRRQCNRVTISIRVRSPNHGESLVTSRYPRRHFASRRQALVAERKFEQQALVL